MVELQARRTCKHDQDHSTTKGATVSPIQTKTVDHAESHGTEEEGVFVTNGRLDDFIKLSGEFIIFKNYFDLFCRDSSGVSSAEDAKKAMKGFSHDINKLTGRLQDQIMEVRKIALNRAFSKLPRMVRQTCQELGKRVKLVQTGMELGVDKSIAKALSGAMTHIVRNSIDHGMESPAQRIILGKPEEGTVDLIAVETKGIISVTVRDNGRGINKTRVLSKAIANGLLTGEDSIKLSDREIFELIFLPGFSTAEKVTDVSGRGVGMDVVRSTVLALNGTIDIRSTEGVGTEIRIDVPIPKTVVIEKTILVQADHSFFAVPITAIAKIDATSSFKLTQVGQHVTCQFDDKTIPVGHYADFAGYRRSAPPIDVSSSFLVVLQHKSDRVGLLVDAVKSQLEAVVRPFDGIIKRVHGCKGTTIIGANRIAYVLSPEDFVGLASTN